MAANENTHFNSTEPGGDGDNPLPSGSIMFLVETEQHLKESWKSILILGIVNTISGLFCLLFPVFATQLAELFLISLVFATGLLNMGMVCFSSNATTTESYQRQGVLFWMGFFQVVAALFMYLIPVFTLTVLTFIIAVAFMMLGSFQIALARQYRTTMAAATFQMLSGAMSVFLSIVIVLSIDTAKWYSLGILLGANILTTGCNRIVLGLYGRKLANTDPDADSWRYVLDHDGFV